jgi:hypothetical protein
MTCATPSSSTWISQPGPASLARAYRWVIVAPPSGIGSSATLLRSLTNGPPMQGAIPVPAVEEVLKLVSRQSVPEFIELLVKIPGDPKRAMLDDPLLALRSCRARGSLFT